MPLGRTRSQRKKTPSWKKNRRQFDLELRQMRAGHRSNISFSVHLRNAKHWMRTGRCLLAWDSIETADWMATNARQHAAAKRVRDEVTQFCRARGR